MVLDDAAPSQAADDIVTNAFLNSGQVRFAIKRVYVPAHRHDEWVESLAARAAALHVGDGREDGVQLGPLSNRPQFERIRALVADALRRAHARPRLSVSAVLARRTRRRHAQALADHHAMPAAAPATSRRWPRPSSPWSSNAENAQ
ncbi:aldehyde dehydrogenase family protein [Streptomyces sp. NPDC005202]|uniref:aldehyde dehydrogenase family protein n=1 Tax=Streptomyces sp. NPDC005202 TaxID=3157021 RepID=UPI00339E96FE